VDHDVINDDTADAYDRLGLSISTDPHQASRDLAGKLGYTWLPLGLHKQKVFLHASETNAISTGAK